MEDGTITLVGATTENPSFELNAALLSRARVLIFKAARRGGDRKSCSTAPRRCIGKPLPLDAGGARLARAHGGRRRPRRAHARRGGLARRRSAGEVFDAEHAAGHRPAPRADLRQGAGGPLQPDLGAAQDDPRLRSRRGALLPRPHARRRRGPALHRPPARARGDRGYRHGRPAGARRSPTRRRTPSTSSARRRASWRSPRRRSISRRRRNRTPLYTAYKAATPDRQGARLADAAEDDPERPDEADESRSATARATPTTTTSRTPSRARITGRRRSAGSASTSRASAASSARCGSVWNGGRSCAASAAGRGATLRRHDPEKWRPVFGKDHAQTRRAARHRRRPSGAARRRRRAAAPSARARDRAPCRHGRCGPRPRPRA